MLVHPSLFRKPGFSSPTEPFTLHSWILFSSQFSSLDPLFPHNVSTTIQSLSIEVVHSYNHQPRQGRQPRETLKQDIMRNVTRDSFIAQLMKWHRLIFIFAKTNAAFSPSPAALLWSLSSSRCPVPIHRQCPCRWRTVHTQYRQRRMGLSTSSLLCGHCLQTRPCRFSSMTCITAMAPPVPFGQDSANRKLDWFRRLEPILVTRIFSVHWKRLVPWPNNTSRCRQHALQRLVVLNLFFRSKWKAPSPRLPTVQCFKNHRWCRDGIPGPMPSSGETFPSLVAQVVTPYYTNHIPSVSDWLTGFSNLVRD